MTLKDVSLELLRDRMGLLYSFDQFRRDVDANVLMEGMDAFNQQAYGILTSSRLADALDYSNEPKRTIEMNGKGDTAIRGDAAPRILEQFLVARCLVEVGVRVSCALLSGGGMKHGQVIVATDRLGGEAT